MKHFFLTFPLNYHMITKLLRIAKCCKVLHDISAKCSCRDTWKIKYISPSAEDASNHHARQGANLMSELTLSYLRSYRLLTLRIFSMQTLKLSPTSHYFFIINLKITLWEFCVWAITFDKNWLAYCLLITASFPYITTKC